MLWQMFLVSSNSIVSSLLGSVGAELAILVILVISGMAAYYALNLSKLLVGGVEKSRARWTAVLSLLLIILVISVFALGAIEIVVVAAALLLTIAGWMDSTIRVAIEQDYFHRNTLHWRTLRPLYWVGFSLTFILAPLIVVFGLAKVAPHLASSFLNVFLTLPSFAYGSITLFVSGQRTRDRKMKSYLRWLAVSVLSILAFGLVLTTYNLNDLVPYLFLILMSYSIFRAARSLSPTTKIERRAGVTST
jgi:hypothetical protein